MNKQEALEIYESFSKPPPEALKPIKGGRLAGMTDIKPQWRIKALTEQFGLCGIGWKYTVDKQWTEQGANGEVFAFVNISFYVKDEDKWSEAIPGTGGSMLIAKEKNGLHCNDEAFKMATTDALSVASKHIGVAASVYMGQTSGKYDTPQNKPNIVDNIEKEFSGHEILKEGLVPQSFWNIPKEQRYNYIEKGCKLTKIDNKYMIVRAEAKKKRANSNAEKSPFHNNDENIPF